jgi:hypothetical protein
MTKSNLELLKENAVHGGPEFDEPDNINKVLDFLDTYL